jgi:hypothetical protein
MGAGASALDALPAQLDEKDAKKFAGDKFNKAAFDKAAKNGKVSRDAFLKAAAPNGAPAKGGKAPAKTGSKAPAGLKKGAAGGGGKGRAGGSGLIAKAKEAAAESSPAAASSSEEPAAPPAPAPAPPPHEPVVGKVRVRYSHYCKEFRVVDAVLDFGLVDEEYCISFVFKGAFAPRLLPEVCGGSERTPQLVDGATAITPDGPLRRETDEEGDTHIVGTLSGLQLVDEGTGQQMTYQLFVDEDEVAEDAARGGAARTGYQRADADGLSGATRASAGLTAELKGLSVDELRGQSDKYKALLEARDLEDVLYGAG